MFSHITLGSNDLDRAIAFYAALMPVLGLAQVEGVPEQGYATWATAPETAPQFLVLRPLDGRPASVGNGTTIGFEARARATVDAFHAAALAAGGRCEGPPGLRPQYHPDYYGTYVRDPDGHKLCCVCHLPAPGG